MVSINTVLIVIAPYVLSKVAIAANTALLQSFFGEIGGPTLSAEAAALQLQFVLVGSAMGAMRALSILVAAMRDESDDDDLVAAVGAETAGNESGADDETSCLRGWLQLTSSPTLSPSSHADDSRTERLRSLFTVAFLGVTAYSIAASLLLAFAGSFLSLFSPHMRADVAAAAQSYSRGFAVGVAPTLWLYCVEQFLLGLHASGAAAIIGVVYAVVCTLLCWAWYPAHGAFGLGLGMSVGAWVVFVVASVALAIDPVYRGLCSPIAVWRAIRSWVCDVGGAQRLVRVFVEYQQLALPLGLSNVVGLLVGLAVTAVVDDSSGNRAQQDAFSIASSFYQTLGIAVLGASSAVSAVVAAATHQRHEQRRASAVVSSAVVCVAALALAVLPLLFTRPFARFFGGAVNSVSDATLGSVTDGDIRDFLVPACLSFCLATMAMSAAASLHALKDVTAPLLLHIAVYALGAVWIVTARVVFHSVVAAAYGTIVGPLLYLLTLLWRWRARSDHADLIALPQV